MKYFIIIFSLSFFALGCQTIHVKNGEDRGTYTQQDWHHIGVLQLVEFSDPVNLKQRCQGGEWQSVQTRTGPLQVLVRFFTAGIYDPEEVQVACKN